MRTRRKAREHAPCACCLCVAWGRAGGSGRLSPPAAAEFQDPLDAAAPSTRFTATTHLTRHRAGRQPAGGVGMRGLIVLSDDEGKTWRQAPVPVSSDLVSVRFVTPSRGWACGHDGVILRTSDGGAHLGQAAGRSHGCAVAGQALRCAGSRRRCRGGPPGQGSGAQLRRRPGDGDARPVVRERAGSAGRRARSAPCWAPATAARPGSPGWSASTTPSCCTTTPCAESAASAVPRLRAGHRCSSSIAPASVSCAVHRLPGQLLRRASARATT